jgi:predicted RNase H-like nuclease (RuvC/YqgF family)
MEGKQAEIEKLQRQLDRLQRNFTKMVKDSDEADKMLDWINEIRKRLKKLAE